MRVQSLLPMREREEKPQRKEVLEWISLWEARINAERSTETPIDQQKDLATGSRIDLTESAIRLRR